ncbi:MAG: hypothetical protein ACYDH5_12975 [Acidimicrobiales bacterium]
MIAGLIMVGGGIPPLVAGRSVQFGVVGTLQGIAFLGYGIVRLTRPARPVGTNREQLPARAPTTSAPTADADAPVAHGDAVVSQVGLRTSPERVALAAGVGPAGH